MYCVRDLFVISQFKLALLSDGISSKTASSKSDHHQHNGNVASVIPYIDSNEKCVDIETEKVAGGDDKVISLRDIDAVVHDHEIVSDAEGQNDKDVETTKETNGYEHSLWKWPTGQTCFTKVSYVMHINKQANVIIFYSRKIMYFFCILDCLDSDVANSSSVPIYNTGL